MIQWQNRLVTSLQPNEVFVFGSNSTGFHGAGAAGLAFRGDASNTWRTDPFFLTAMKSKTPTKGKWAVFGQARGYQEGTEGASYAVETIVRPGQKRSMSLNKIYDQLVDLNYFAQANPEKQFLITPLGEGYSGYTFTEMKLVWNTLEEEFGLAPNLTFVRPSANVVTLS